MEFSQNVMKNINPKPKYMWSDSMFFTQNIFNYPQNEIMKLVLIALALRYCRFCEQSEKRIQNIRALSILYQQNTKNSLGYKASK